MEISLGPFDVCQTVQNQGFRQHAGDSTVLACFLASKAEWDVDDRSHRVNLPVIRLSDRL